MTREILIQADYGDFYFKDSGKFDAIDEEISWDDYCQEAFDNNKNATVLVVNKSPYVNFDIDSQAITIKTPLDGKYYIAAYGDTRESEEIILSDIIKLDEVTSDDDFDYFEHSIIDEFNDLKAISTNSIVQNLIFFLGEDNYMYLYFEIKIKLLKSIDGFVAIESVYMEEFFVSNKLDEFLFMYPNNIEDKLFTVSF